MTKMSQVRKNDIITGGKPRGKMADLKRRALLWEAQLGFREEISNE